MSSDETVRIGWKKKRLGNACDQCRKRVRDSATRKGQCTNCAAFAIDCTHNAPEKKRGPKSIYVGNLEKKVKTMEETLRKFGVPIDETSRSHASTSSAVSDSPSFNGVPSSISSNPGYPSLAAESPPPSDSLKQEEEEDFAHVALADHLSKLSLNTVQRRFMGPSSAFMIMKNAHRMKEETLGHDTQPFKRPQYWGMQAWEKASSERETPLYTFPETDLMVSLISLYFAEVNIFLPIVHTPSFNQCVAQGLHFHDHNFATMLLLVCAVGSRYSNDPRVFADPSSQLSCGWHYFDQVQMMRRSILEVPTLYELQFYCLATIYMLGTSSPSSSWILCAAGIRFAEELGVHRRQPEGSKWTSLDEQKRRAFWVLVSLDRLISSFVGRPSAIRDEDFDCDLPLECDDEYWENPHYPELSFKQPEDKPSIISCFNSHLRLCEILAFALRTLYSTKKSKLLLGRSGEEWEQKILRELDSALKKWFDTVPSHLRWNPERPDSIFFRQSVFLFTMYYNVQIQSHRPFLQKASEASFHSLAVCTNAARTTIHVLEAAHMSRATIGLPQILYGAFISAMVVMLNLWGSKRAGIRIEYEKDIEKAKVIMDMLHGLDQRWNIAGRFWDMLSELVKDFNHIDYYQPPNQRTRNNNEPIERLPSSAELAQISLPRSQTTTSYQSQARPAHDQSYNNAHSTQFDAQISADTQLASQLLYGWRLTGESPPAWTNQQTAQSLTSIDKKTVAYLEQIFGRIENFQNDPGVAYGDDQSVYQGANQSHYSRYPSQLQPGYEGEVPAMSGGTENAAGFLPNGFDYNAWSYYIESMGLSNIAVGGSYQ